jgi:hypothetical protein
VFVGEPWDPFRSREKREIGAWAESGSCGAELWLTWLGLMRGIGRTHRSGSPAFGALFGGGAEVVAAMLAQEPFPSISPFTLLQCGQEFRHERHDRKN